MRRTQKMYTGKEEVRGGRWCFAGKGGRRQEGRENTSKNTRVLSPLTVTASRHTAAAGYSSDRLTLTGQSSGHTYVPASLTVLPPPSLRAASPFHRGGALRRILLHFPRLR